MLDIGYIITLIYLHPNSASLTYNPVWAIKLTYGKQTQYWARSQKYLDDWNIVYFSKE